jgi:hypothetical protein
MGNGAYLSQAHLSHERESSVKGMGENGPLIELVGAHLLHADGMQFTETMLRDQLG